MGDNSLLNAEAIIAAARSTTGLHDFRHEHFRPGLDKFVESLNADASLTDDGVQSYFQQLVAIVVNRLMADRLFTDKPEILEQPLGPMLVITGLPRTGTTKLQRMLARHPDVRSIPIWQQILPVPFGSDRTAEGDPRREMIAGSLLERFSSDPELNAIHPMGVDEPEEEAVLMTHSISTAAFFGVHAPSYDAWQREQDLAWVYADLEDWLKLIQWQDDTIGRPWVLKNVVHTADINHLVRHFPQAQVVWPHRDPARVLPSWCSLIEITRKASSDAYDPAVLGADMLDYWAWASERAVTHREGLPPERFLDVAYDDIVNNIDDVLERVLDHAGLAASGPATESMHSWADAHPQHQGGRHQYSLEDFGLTQAAIDERFQTYSTRFAPWLG